MRSESPDEDGLEALDPLDGGEGGRYDDGRAVVTAHRVERDGDRLHPGRFVRDLFFLADNHLPASVVAVGADVVAPVRLPGLRLDGKARRPQRIVGAPHPALRARLAILLNGHVSGSSGASLLKLGAEAGERRISRVGGAGLPGDGTQTGPVRGEVRQGEQYFVLD